MVVERDYGDVATGLLNFDLHPQNAYWAGMRQLQNGEMPCASSFNLNYLLTFFESFINNSHLLIYST